MLSVGTRDDSRNLNGIAQLLRQLAIELPRLEGDSAQQWPCGPPSGSRNWWPRHSAHSGCAGILLRKPPPRRTYLPCRGKLPGLRMEELRGQQGLADTARVVERR